MVFVVFFTLFILVGLGFLIRVRIKDRQYLDKPVREVLGQAVQKEIQAEKMEFKKHQDNFEKAVLKVTREKHVRFSTPRDITDKDFS